MASIYGIAGINLHLHRNRRRDGVLMSRPSGILKDGHIMVRAPYYDLTTEIEQAALNLKADMLRKGFIINGLEFTVTSVRDTDEQA